MDIKPIETVYNGYRFRSRLEARWAVFLDAIGADWEYEPEGFDLGNGIFYLPDFKIRTMSKYYRTPTEFYLEVKGVPTKEAGVKCRLLSKHYPVLIVGDIPRAHGDFRDCLYGYFNIDDDGYKVDCVRDSFTYIDGDSYPCLLCADTDGGVGLYGPDWWFDVDPPADEKKTIRAFDKARQARFEHGETPTT